MEEATAPTYIEDICFFRSLVAEYKSKYIRSCPKDKKEIKRIIVDYIHQLDPPGRFLTKNRMLKGWTCMSHKDALKKTGQALREDAPRIREAVSARLQATDQHHAVLPLTNEVPHPKPMTDGNCTNIRNEGQSVGIQYLTFVTFESLHLSPLPWL